LGAAPEQPFVKDRFQNWRWYWDFGGGALTDLFSHWGDTIHWYLGLNEPSAVQAMGQHTAMKEWDCPDTINASWQYPSVQVVYNGAMTGNLDGGGIVFRGTRAMMKINRTELFVYSEEGAPAERTQYPEAEIHVVSKRDGTIDHLENWLDCLRSRKAPNSPVRAAIASANTAHRANAALRKNMV
jgi:predicted dehydrogenase